MDEPMEADLAHPMPSVICLGTPMPGNWNFDTTFGYYYLVDLQL